MAVGALTALFASQAGAVLAYDQNVTNNAIFGSGNANGGYTTDRDNGVELGLRGKLRHDATGQPQNVWNSNGDGTYSFSAGVAPTQAAPTAVWSFEWSINSNYDSSAPGRNLSGLTYRLGVDTDQSAVASYLFFDIINGANPDPTKDWWDHSIGTNATAQGAGTEATDDASYAALIGGNNLAQNSWKPHWYIPGFNPGPGEWSFILEAFDGTGARLASTEITVLVPEPGTIALAGLALLGLASRRIRRR